MILQELSDAQNDIDTNDYFLDLIWTYLSPCMFSSLYDFYNFFQYKKLYIFL